MRGLANRGRFRGLVTGLLAASFPFVAHCGLDAEGGGASGGPEDASAGNLADVHVASGGSGGLLVDASAESSAGSAGLAGGGGVAGVAGTGGSAGLGGGGGTGGLNCDSVGANCTADQTCCTGWCGPGPAPKAVDCYIYNKCAECRDNAQCASGRCDACKCAPTEKNGATCDEDSDCTSAECGPKPGDDPKDCYIYNKCAECRDDTDCTPGRCDACKCEALLGKGSSCDEDSDCATDKCGPKPGDDVRDCYIYNKCSECTHNSECSSGRCDACACASQLGHNASCDENSDCQSNDCSLGKCTKP